MQADIDVPEEVRKAVGTRLASVRTGRNRNQLEFAADTGVTPLTLGRYERGERLVTTEFALHLAQIAGISPTWLFLGSGAPSLDQTVDGLLPDGFVKIPKLDVNAAAGHGAVNDSERIVGYHVCAEGTLRAQFGVAPADCRIITAVGDSMLPDIAGGDELLVDISVRRFAGDAIYVIRIEDGLQVKQLQHVNAQFVKVISRNAQYEPYCALAGPPGIVVCGRVLGKVGYVRF